MSLESATKKQKRDLREPESPRVATQQDIEDWLNDDCAESEQYDSQSQHIGWLSQALTAEYAYLTVVDAALAQGPRFGSWYAHPPYHMEVDEFVDHQDPEDALHHAAARAHDERVEALNYCRKSAILLLMTWLGQGRRGADECSLTPSLTTLCAQKAAMGLFSQVVDELSNFFTYHKKGKAEVVKSCVENAIGTDFPHQDLVRDELYIVLVVYELLQDFRTLTCWEDAPTDLRLPFWFCPPIDDDEDGDYRWFDHAVSICNQVVPWHGRGRLAKVVLLLHSLTVSLLNANDMGDIYVATSYHCLSLWEDATDHLDCHPLALQGSLSQLKALSEFVTLRCHDESISKRVVERILPDIRVILSDVDGEMYEKPKQATLIIPEEELLREMIRRATSIARDEEKRTIPETERALQILRAPLQFNLDSKSCLTECIGFLEQLVSKQELDEYSSTYECRRLRLSGDHSKETLLRAVLAVHRSVETLDLENCENVDEDMLDVLTGCCQQLRLVLLFGTNVPPDCPVVKNLQKWLPAVACIFENTSIYLIGGRL